MLNTPDVSQQRSQGSQFDFITENKTTILVCVVAVIIGFGIGMSSASVFNTGKQQPQQQQLTKNTADVTPTEEPIPGSVATDTRAADLRVLLATLYREHVNLMSAVARRSIQGEPELEDEAAYKQVTQNSAALASTFGSIYGPDAESRFLRIWEKQNKLYLDYSVAVKSNNANVSEAAQALQMNINELSSFYAEQNPTLPRDGVMILLTSQVSSFKEAIDAYAGKDYLASYEKEVESANQIGYIADTLSGAIVRQYPERF